MSKTHLLKRKIHRYNKNDEFGINESVIVHLINYPKRYGKIICRSKIDKDFYVKTKDMESYTECFWLDKSCLRKITFL